MIERSDSLRISQTALTKAGACKLERALNKDEQENLASLIKFMVENSAIASGKRKRGLGLNPPKRRRYGDFILVLKEHTLVDFIASRPDWCSTCLGVRRGTDCTCLN